MNGKLRKSIGINKILFILIFAATIIIFTAMNHRYVSITNISNILKQAAIISISGLGLTYVVAVNRSDISFYLNACFAAVFACWLVDKAGVPGIVALIAGLGVGCLWGLVSGVLAGVLNLPDMIITIAIGCISYGCAYIFSNGELLFVSHTDFAAVNNSYVGGIAVPTLIMIVLYVVSYIVLERTKLGTKFYAAGNNKKAAYFSGINVTAITVAAFVICSCFAAMAGMINAASKGSASVDIASSFLMPSFTAVYVGIAIFKRPCVIGTFLGALLVQMLSNGFIMINVAYYYGDMITAWTLILALFISIIRTKNVIKPAVSGAKKTVVNE